MDAETAAAYRRLATLRGLQLAAALAERDQARTALRAMARRSTSLRRWAKKGLRDLIDNARGGAS